MLRLDPVYAARAAVVSAKAKDIAEFLSGIELPAASQAIARRPIIRPAPCSMARRWERRRKRFCAMPASRFRIFRKAISAAARPAPTTSCSPKSPRSSGTGKSKISRSTNPQVIATGNIGCITQLATGMQTPILHTVELLDWAYGGPKPDKLKASQRRDLRMARMPAGVTFRGSMLPEYRSILTPEALAFLADLHRNFDGERQRLLALRAAERQAFQQGRASRFSARDPRHPRRRHGVWRRSPPTCRTAGLKSPGRRTARW